MATYYSTESELLYDFMGWFFRTVNNCKHFLLCSMEERQYFAISIGGHLSFKLSL